MISSDREIAGEDQMKLWMIVQVVNTGYDTFDSAIVAAETEEDARQINPSGDWDNLIYPAWANTPDQVTVILIGEAIPGTVSGIVLSSFNAG